MRQHETESATAPNEVKQSRFLSPLFQTDVKKQKDIRIVWPDMYSSSPYTSCIHSLSIQTNHPFKVIQTFIDFSDRESTK